MSREERKPLGSGLVMSALLLMLTAGAALAAIPSTNDDRNATQPMITGTVLMVNEHQLLVATEQGDEVLLALDTRSVVPVDLAAEQMVRVQFHYLNDGSRHAGRVIPVRSGQKTTRELAYSRERDDDGEAVAQYASTSTQGDDPNLQMREDMVATGTHRTLVRPMRTVPATHDYEIATKPTIAGRVVDVNDHRIVVDSENSGRVTLQMDSRTVVPSTLRSGMGVRVDHVAMTNGEYRAQRVTEDDAYAGIGESVTYVPPTEEPVAQNTDAEPATYQRIDSTGDVAANDGGTEPTYATDEERLPQTASPQPLIALLGLLAIGAAGALALRHRHVG